MLFSEYLVASLQSESSPICRPVFVRRTSIYSAATSMLSPCFSACICGYSDSSDVILFIFLTLQPQSCSSRPSFFPSSIDSRSSLILQKYLNSLCVDCSPKVWNTRNWLLYQPQLSETTAWAHICFFTASLFPHLQHSLTSDSLGGVFCNTQKYCARST